MTVYGPYVRDDGRSHVIHYDPITQSRRTQSYPRYLLEQHLGRELELWEDADHINEDPTDDRLENLQVLTHIENVKKSARDPEIFAFNCSVCGSYTEKPASKVRHNRKQGKTGPYCSKRCAGMAKSANAVALKATDESLPGSNPGVRTSLKIV